MKKQFTTTHSYNRNAVQLTIKAPTILELLNSLRQLKAMQSSHTIPPSDEKNQHRCAPWHALFAFNLIFKTYGGRLHARR